jgi:hypothetical protein
MITQSNATHTQKGWVSQPNNRGTLDILWSSLITTFLCTWTVLCLNLPEPEEPKFRIFLRKLRWMALAIIGPEFVLAFAFGQWVAAKNSVSDFEDLGFKDWSETHAHFANMGGFVLQPRDSRPFPINGTQLHWLVLNKYLKYPCTKKKIIWDKSKANTLVKALTVAQILWFLLQCLGRAIQKIAITTLELSVMAIVACSLATFYCWLHKPADVETAIILESHASIREILVEAGEAASKAFRQTPLDFVDDFCPSWSIDVMEAKTKLRTGPQQRPLERLGNDRLPKYMGSAQKTMLCFLSLIFGGIHFAGWNFDFPSSLEKLLWRACSATIFATTIGFWLVERRDIWRFHGVLEHWLNPLFRLKEAENLAVDFLGRSEIPFRCPWYVFLLFAIIAASYTLARIYTLVEVFVGLRDLPDTAFQTVQWTNFLPHI